MRRRKTDEPEQGRGDILSQVPSAEYLERRLVELREEASRVQRVLDCVRAIEAKQQAEARVVG